MTVDDLVKFYNAKNIPDLHEKSEFKLATLYYWHNNGIPEDEQALLELRSNHILRADIKKPALIPPANDVTNSPNIA